MTYREFYAPTKSFDSASLVSTIRPDTRSTTILQEYYAPNPSRIATGFHGQPFHTGIEPEFFDNLHGHSSAVVAIAFSPDGAHVAAGSRTGELRIWSIIKPGLRRDLLGHTDMVAAVAYSTSGNLIASGSADQSVRVWNAASGQNLQIFTGHTSTIVAVAFPRSGGCVVSGSEDKTIRNWNLSTGSCQIVSGQKPRLADVAFSANGNSVALSSSGDNPSLKLFDLVEPKYQFLSGLGALAHAVTFSPNGETVVAGLADNTVQYWDIAKDESTILIGHEAPVFAVTCSIDEKLVVSGSADGTVRIWSRQSPPNHLTIAFESRVWAVSYSPDGETIAVGLGNGMVRLFGVTRQERPSVAKRVTSSMRKLFK